LAAFRFLRNYCSNITQKKIPIQSTVQFFSDVNKSDELKKIQGNILVMRQEFLDLLKNFTHFISSKLLSLDGESYLCLDKNMEAVYEEVARFLHSHLFQGKTLIYYQPLVNNDQPPLLPSQKEEAIVIPSVDTIHRQIKNQQKKSMYNQKNYQRKKKEVKNGGSKKSSRDDEEEEEHYSTGDEENALP
jgi:hypothetical protein